MHKNALTVAYAPISLRSQFVYFAGACRSAGRRGYPCDVKTPQSPFQSVEVNSGMEVCPTTATCRRDHRGLTCCTCQDWGGLPKGNPASRDSCVK